MVRDVAGIVVLAAIYYVAARLSLRLALVERNITPLWPPTGIAVVAFIWFGRRRWPGIALGAFLVNLPISATWTAALATAGGNTLAPLLAATLLARAGFRTQIDRLTDALALVFLGALLSMTVSATVGTAVLVATDVIQPSSFLESWSVWWAGDAMGVLVVAPFLLTIRRIQWHRPPPLGRWVEAVAMLGLLAAVASFALTSRHPALFAIIPFLGWAAWRFQQAAAAPAALIIVAVATWAVVNERGPFADSPLLDRMLLFQVFNAVVALTSFVFAAMVAERAVARRTLERSASELEERVRQRTRELSAANRQLARRERELAEAQELARMGSWSWDLETGVVSWSDELYRIHGYGPRAFPVTFDRVLELVDPADRERIEHNVRAAIEQRLAVVPEIDYRIRQPDGDVRVLHGAARLAFDDRGAPHRMVGTVQDVTDRREAEREHRIAVTLQRALLPSELPTIDGLELAARYVPAEPGASAGGDWYDVVPLPDSHVGLVIGDVAGHGLDAATVMGQVRVAVRAYAVEGAPPTKTVHAVHALLRELYAERQMVTMQYVVVDQASHTFTMVSAGHPPPLIVSPSGGATYAEPRQGLPLGVDMPGFLEESVMALEPGASIVLYTDGLVDRRERSVTDGLEDLRAAAEELADRPLDDLCGGLLDRLGTGGGRDDIALLAARLSPVVPERFALTVEARPDQLASIRRRLSAWLSAMDVPEDDRDDLVIACSEACGNAVEHAYGPDGGLIEVRAAVVDGSVAIDVEDHGHWRSRRGNPVGRGLTIIDAVVDSLDVARSPGGTAVRMRRRIRDVSDPGGAA